MKTLISIAFFLIAVYSAFAQNNFEGRITYQLTGNRGKINALADVYFKTNKIKAALRTATDAAKSKDDLIILLDSGIVYHLNLDKGSYKKDDMKQPFIVTFPKFVKTPIQNKHILGFSCKAERIEKIPGNRFMGGVDITLWPADSLFFPCNKKFATNEMSMVFINGTTINLAALLIFDTPEGKDTATVNAVDIQQAILEDSIFFLPAGITPGSDIINQSNTVTEPTEVAANTAVDSVTRIVDSLVEAAVKQGTDRYEQTSKRSTIRASSNRSSKNTHKQPTKPSATKPKE